MAKSKNVSNRSRAARRETDPSLNEEQSLKRLPRADAAQDQDITAVHYNSGITKKTKNKKVKSRAQRLRQEKGAERAEKVLERTATKVDKSVGRGKNVKARKAAWEEMNLKNEEENEAQNGDTPKARDNDDVDMGENINMGAIPQQPQQPQPPAVIAPTTGEAAPQEQPLTEATPKPTALDDDIDLIS